MINFLDPQNPLFCIKDKNLNIQNAGPYMYGPTFMPTPRTFEKGGGGGVGGDQLGFGVLIGRP